MDYEELDPEILFHIEKYNIPYTENVTKNNIVKNLWNIIKDTSHYISDASSRITTGIRNLINTKGNIQVGTKLAEQVGLTPSDHIKFDIKDKNDEDLIIGKMISSMIEEIDQDKFTIICPAKLVSTNPMNADIKGKNINAAWDRTRKVLKLIDDPSPILEYKEFFTKLINHTADNFISEEDIEDIYDIIMQFSDRSPMKDYALDFMTQNITHKGGLPYGEYSKVTVSLQALIDFQKLVNEMCDLGQQFDDKFTSLNVKRRKSRGKKSNVTSHKVDDPFVKVGIIKKRYINILNELSWTCVELQGGLNAICNGLQGIYEVSPKYYGSVNTPDQLAKFIDQAIPTGMPGKYIVRNIFNICTDQMKGNIDPDNPMMGFGRLTLFPEGKIVYKVAINQYGIRSNKNDFDVIHTVNMINEKSFKEKFADLYHTYGNYAINEVEKVKVGKENEPSFIEARTMVNDINAKFRQKGANIRIQDVKPDAFGKRGNKYVLVDYGYTHRRSPLTESIQNEMNHPKYKGNIDSFYLQDEIDIGYELIE